jgi:acyl-CoA thioester hydrolase
MPRVHHTSFRVRYDECDAYGLINNPNLVRYMHEAGLQAGSELGFDRKDQAGVDDVWMATHMQADFLSPARYGDDLDDVNWLSAVIDGGWHRVHEIRRKGDDDVLARATLEWVLSERESGRRLALPERIRTGLGDAEQSESGPAWEIHEADAGWPPDGALSQRRMVAWRDVDPQGCVNVAAYVDYMTEAGIEAGSAHGWTLDRCQAQGVAFVVRQHTLECLLPVGLGESLTVTTWLSRVRRSTGLRHYTVQREKDGRPVARGATRWVVIDPTSMRPSRLPNSFADDFGAHIST